LTTIFRWPANNKIDYDGQKYDSISTGLPYLVGGQLIRSRSIIGFVGTFSFLNANQAHEASMGRGLGEEAHGEPLTAIAKTYNVSQMAICRLQV
jgi:hypothetical protein